MSTNEFPHILAASKIGPVPTDLNFAANERECAALARRYNILGVQSVDVEARLVREADGMTIAVTGKFVANVTQACVTTLEPVPDRIEEEFEGFFLDESQARSFMRAKKRKVEVDDGDMPLEDDEAGVTDERDDPEPVTNGAVDVGELVAQYLSLALNPYPHSEKALAEGPLGEETDVKKPNPFAVLKDLKGG